MQNYMLEVRSFFEFLVRIPIVYLSLIEILTKIINHTNKEIYLEALHPGNLWQGLK
jgi:hypothetical protein